MSLLTSMLCAGCCILLTLVIKAQKTNRAKIVQCYSCSKSCDSKSTDCDCGPADTKYGNMTSSSKMYTICHGFSCFVTKYNFSQYGSDNLIMKGCENDDSQLSKAFCRSFIKPYFTTCSCFDNFCNQESLLNNWPFHTSPKVTCCQWNRWHITHDEKCRDKCSGAEYCFAGNNAIKGGCLYAAPRHYSVLRFDYQQVSSFVTEKPLCMKVDDEIEDEYCVCDKDFCNNFTISGVPSAVMGSPVTCYYVKQTWSHVPSKEELKEVAKQNCTGTVCYIAYNSHQESSPFEPNFGNATENVSNMTFVPARGTLYVESTVYEVNAGCIATNAPSGMVNVGCSSNYFDNENEPLAKYCICKEQYCNDPILAISDYPTSGASDMTNIQNILRLIWIFVTLIITPNFVVV